LPTLQAQPLFDRLNEIPDPRRDQTKRHLLGDILTIAVCATIAGAEGWDDSADFGVAKQNWFATFLALPNGIPSHDTFRRVFLLLKPALLAEVFRAWVQSAVELSAGQLINIDGKRLRGSKKKADGSGALHFVSAWAGAQGVVLGQVKTEEKSNEITAIPELLKLLEVSGCIVTIDAMGCQREIVKQIQEQGGDYVISLKGNQETLHQEVKDYMDWGERSGFEDIEHDYCETLEKGHGRIEERRCWVAGDLEWLTKYKEWKGLRSVIMVEAEREVLGGAKSVERRYFISSLGIDAQQALGAVRGHWGIENQLHWSLDVSFGEDRSRIRSENGAENLAVLRHMGLNLLKQEKSSRRGLAGRRKNAGWNETYLAKVLCIYSRFAHF
jgi:predicted transposase YbfD/YdcC